jgi:hypothetical protein
VHILLGTTGHSWDIKVVQPCADIVTRFLSKDTALVCKNSSDDIGGTRVASRELWTQYVCEVIVFFPVFLQGDENSYYLNYLGCFSCHFSRCVSGKHHSDKFLPFLILCYRPATTESFEGHMSGNNTSKAEVTAKEHND